MNENEKSKSNNKIKYATAAILGGAGLYLGGKRFFKHMNQAPNIIINGVNIRPPGVSFINKGRKLSKTVAPNKINLLPTPIWPNINKTTKLIESARKRKRLVVIKNRSKKRAEQVRYNRNIKGFVRIKRKKKK